MQLVDSFETTFVGKLLFEPSQAWMMSFHSIVHCPSQEVELGDLHNFQYSHLGHEASKLQKMTSITLMHSVNSVYVKIFKRFE